MWFVHFVLCICVFSTYILTVLSSCSEDGVCEKIAEHKSSSSSKYSQSSNTDDRVQAFDHILLLQKSLGKIVRDPSDMGTVRQAFIHLSDFVDTPYGSMIVDQMLSLVNNKDYTSELVFNLVYKLANVFFDGKISLDELYSQGVRWDGIMNLASTLMSTSPNEPKFDRKYFAITTRKFLNTIKKERNNPLLLQRMVEVLTESISSNTLAKINRRAVEIFSRIQKISDHNLKSEAQEAEGIKILMFYLKDIFEKNNWDWRVYEPIIREQIQIFVTRTSDGLDFLNSELLTVLEDLIENNNYDRNIIFRNFANILYAYNRQSIKNIKLIFQQYSDKISNSKTFNDNDQELDTIKFDESITDQILQKISNMLKNPINAQKIIEEVFRSVRNLDMSHLMQMFSNVKGLDLVLKYANALLTLKDGKQISNYFHSLVEDFGSGIEVLEDRQTRLSSIQVLLPYIRYVHVQLKDPLALVKLSMGYYALVSMYGAQTSSMIKLANHYLSDTLLSFGYTSGLEQLSQQVYASFIDFHGKVYGSNQFDKMKEQEEDLFLVDSFDRYGLQPISSVITAYRRARETPHCFRKLFCDVNRNAAQVDDSHMGVGHYVTRRLSQMFGTLIMTSRNGFDFNTISSLDSIILQTDCSMFYDECEMSSRVEM